MIASTIGRIFLNAYNEKYRTNYDAKTFFEKVYFPIIFGGEKYAQWVQNSPFVQGLRNLSKYIKAHKNDPEVKNSHFVQERVRMGIENVTYIKVYKDKNKKESFKPITKDVLEESLADFESKISHGAIDASVALGYPASIEEGFNTTSAQVTDIQIPVCKDDVLLSWVGNSLAIGVQDGFQILFMDKTVLLDIFRGWSYYRLTLYNNRKLPGKQLNAWNGQWLVHYYNKYLFDKDNPMSNFPPPSNKNGLLNVDSISWTKALIALAQKSNKDKVVGYIYKIDKVNTTIGFIPFNLHQIRKPVQLYEHFFGIDSEKKAEPLWGTAYAFKTACENGVIGLMAMKPKGLRNYMQGSLPKPEKDNEQRISYNTYIIWILAMLNNDELWTESQELAQLLMDASIDNDKKISTKNSNAVETVLKAVNKKQFIDAVKAIVPALSSVDELLTIVKDINSMPTDNVPYFLTLMRFQYAALNKKSNH